MSFGLRTWSASGALELDTDNFTYQVIHSQTYSLTLKEVLTVPVSGFDPDRCSASILPISPPNGTSISGSMPYMTVTVGSITIRSVHPNESSSSGGGSTMTFRLLVTRFRN